MINKNFVHTSKLAVAAVVMSAAAVATAQADDGFYVSGSVTATDLSHNINRNTGSADSASASTTVSQTDVGFRLGLGYKRHVTEDWFVAVEGFYSFENAETRSLNGMLVSTLELDASYGGDFRVGYDITDKFAMYALAGVTALEFENSTAYTFAPPMQEISKTEAGFTYGIGAEIQLTNKMSVVGEYRITNDISFTPNADRVGSLVNDNQIDHGALRLGVNFSF